MNSRKSVIMREDIYRDMDIILLPDDIFEIEGYSAANIDDTGRIDDYIRHSISGIADGGSIDLYINYGFTRALVSALNIIFQKNLECSIYIYDNAAHDYVNFGKLEAQAGRHLKESSSSAEFQLINRSYKKALPESIQHVFEESEIRSEHLFDADYFNRTAYDSLKNYAGGPCISLHNRTETGADCMRKCFQAA